MNPVDLVSHMMEDTPHIFINKFRLFSLKVEIAHWIHFIFTKDRLELLFAILPPAGAMRHKNVASDTSVDNEWNEFVVIYHYLFCLLLTITLQLQVTQTLND